MDIQSYAGLLMGLLMAPFLLGIINRTKAFFAGRRGSPLLQAYFDLFKLLRHKQVVYSRTTTWIFRAAPSVVLASVVSAMLVIPVACELSPLSFQGDLILFAYFLALARFFTVAAALDTGSSFEGMGASREVLFSALAEPALLIGMSALVRVSGSLSLSSIFSGITEATWHSAGPAIVLVGIAFFIVLLVENSRMPFDDPNTHLELTMIHEVMILDYSGPDLGLVLYAASLKLWVMAALIINIFLPLAGLSGIFSFAAFAAGMVLVAVLIGIVESVMARVRLLKVPQLLVGAAALSILAFTLVLRFTL